MTPTEHVGLGLWNRLEVTDPAFAKKFDKGNFKGTAVDATYNIKRVTEQLGPVGFAWGWSVLREEYRSFGAEKGEQVIHTCTVRAWFRQPDGGVREVDHVGTTKMAYWSRGSNSYFVVDDEAPKKSVTDALSKIMMSLGASADIWLGRFDGNQFQPPVVDPDPPPASRQHETADKPRLTAVETESGDMKQLVHVVDGDGVVVCTTSIWQEAIRRYGEVKKVTHDKLKVQKANLPMLRTVEGHATNGMRDKVKAEITAIVAESVAPKQAPAA